MALKPPLRAALNGTARSRVVEADREHQGQHRQDHPSIQSEPLAVLEYFIHVCTV